MYFDRRTALKAIIFACLPGCSTRGDSERIMSSQPNLPRTILPSLAWSFKEPLPATPSLFLAALRAYGERIRSPLDEAELETRFPLNSIDVEYSYAEETESGWLEIPATIRVRRTASFTYAELLYEIHSASADKLHDQDHSYFEGLVLLERQNETGIPVYEMYLGS
jgi:hypothetical protein